MFEFVRTHTRLLQLLLLVLILPSFVVFGIQGYSRFQEGSAQDVARVAGRAISQGEWDAAHQRQVERVRQQMPNVDARLFDSPEARAETLEQLVRERVLLEAVRTLHVVTPDARLQRVFVSDPQFAPMRNADGSVNKELLAAQGMTSDLFAARLRQDLSVQQVVRGVSESALATTSTVTSAVQSLLQRREIRYARFDAKDYLARVEPTPADVEAYYKSHEAEFRTPEQAVIEYAVLDLDVVMKRIAVTDEDLRKYYAENASRFTSAEERQARHVLVKADKDAPPDVRQKAKAKAESLLAELRKSPASFAEVARKNSDDEGSASQGGDLGFFGRGAMVKPFEDAVFALKAGEISPVIETDFGYHVIKVEALRGGSRKPFEEVRASIEADVRRGLATKGWAEAAEQFTNTVYEQSDSLQPVIDRLKLEKLTATVQRSPAPDAKGALASPKLLEAVFGTDAIKSKRNTDAVETGPNQLASARIVEHRPQRTLPLEEVKDRVLARVKAQQAAAMARTEGEKRLAQLRSASPGELPTQATVSRNKPEGLEPQALEAVLRADSAKLPAPVGVEIPGRGYFVARVDKVLAPDVPAPQEKAIGAQLAAMLAQAETDAYYKSLKARFNAETLASPGAAASAPAGR